MEASRELVPQDELVSPYKEDNFPAPTIRSRKYDSLAPIVADLFAQGWSLLGACREVNLSKGTVEYWFKTGHVQALLEHKRDQYRKKFLDRIDEAGNKTWFANAWILERNKAFKGEFAQPKAANQASGNIQINVVVGTSPAGSGGTTVTVGAAPDEGE
jgi:hypothetical protein